MPLSQQPWNTVEHYFKKIELTLKLCAFIPGEQFFVIFYFLLWSLGTHCIAESTRRASLLFVKTGLHVP